MKRLSYILLLAAVCFGGALLLGGGSAPLGRLALGLGLPKLATQFFSDPEWKGVAYYRSGQPDKAAQAFRQAKSFHNLGNALAHAGQYAAALEAYDVARVRGDSEAAANFDLVAAFYAGLALDPDAPVAWFTEKDGGEGAVVKSSIAKGNARAAGAGDATTNSGALLGLPELASHGDERIRKIFDDRFMVANRRWLATLSDVPGEFLKARIAQEHKRREKLGLSPPEAEDPR